MTRAGFEPAIPAIKWPQTYASDNKATGIGYFSSWFVRFSPEYYPKHYIGGAICNLVPPLH
jgi:hypothetical protein